MSNGVCGPSQVQQQPMGQLTYAYSREKDSLFETKRIVYLSVQLAREGGGKPILFGYILDPTTD